MKGFGQSERLVQGILGLRYEGKWELIVGKMGERNSS